MTEVKNDKRGAIRPGDWVAHEKDHPEKVVAVARTYGAVVEKLDASGRVSDVVLFQVPPQNCALIL